MNQEKPRSPVLPLNEAADYVHRSPNAMKVMRSRGRGPKGFVQEGRLYYYVTDLDAWLAEGAASDRRWNPDLDPARIAPEAKRPRRPRKTAAKPPVPSAA